MKALTHSWAKSLMGNDRSVVIGINLLSRGLFILP